MTPSPEQSTAIELVPECKGQAVCTNGRRCLDAGACLRPYQCRDCRRSSINPNLCVACVCDRISEWRRS